jgi:hypothetical protein
MLIAGIAVTVLGFLLAVLSLGITASTNGRLAMVLMGLVLCLYGILGLINRAFQKNAVWRR